ncbi:MAG TPA: hypothetical protein VMB80_12895 [Candidatus Acidoferrum sp.]|nr:hypothetical protein [Candidatus Acidoferrum sp.]
MNYNVTYPYDVAVAVRVCDRSAVKPNLLDLTDRKQLILASMTSLAQSLSKVRAYCYLMLDCEDDLAEKILSLFSSLPNATDRRRLDWRQSFHEQARWLANQSVSGLACACEDDYLYRPDCFLAAVEFMRLYPSADALSLAYHAEYERRWVDRWSGSSPADRPVYCSQRHWVRQVSCTHSFLMRTSAVQSALPTLLRRTNETGDLGLWLALTKLRVRNPWSLVRGWGDGKFIVGSIGLAWLYHWRQILKGRQYLLYAPKPTLATHLERCSASLTWDQGDYK